MQYRRFVVYDIVCRFELRYCIPGCKILDIEYDIIYDIVYDIIHDIICDLVYYILYVVIYDIWVNSGQFWTQSQNG